MGRVQGSGFWIALVLVIVLVLDRSGNIESEHEHDYEHDGRLGTPFYHTRMKRAPELQPLSREHRDGLIVARRLRRGAEGKEALANAVAAFRTAWRGPLAAHFREEEEILLPRLAEVAGKDDAQIARV